jgi:hypothetical protein
MLERVVIFRGLSCPSIYIERAEEVVLERMSSKNPITKAVAVPIHKNLEFLRKKSMLKIVSEKQTGNIKWKDPEVVPLDLLKPMIILDYLIFISTRSLTCNFPVEPGMTVFRPPPS